MMLYPSRPVIEQHVLLVPKSHVGSLEQLSSEEIVDSLTAYKILKKVFRNVYGYTGRNLFVNDGVESGQHVPHVHFHVFGRSINEPENPYDVMRQHPSKQISPEEIRYRIDRIRNEIIRCL